MQIHAGWNESSWHNKVKVIMQYLHWANMHLIRHDAVTSFTPPNPYIIIIIPVKYLKI